jgi:hypothetical protein
MKHRERELSPEKYDKNCSRGVTLRPPAPPLLIPSTPHAVFEFAALPALFIVGQGLITCENLQADSIPKLGWLLIRMLASEVLE